MDNLNADHSAHVNLDGAANTSLDHNFGQILLETLARQTSPGPVVPASLSQREYTPSADGLIQPLTVLQAELDLVTELGQPATLETFTRMQEALSEMTAWVHWYNKR